MKFSLSVFSLFVFLFFAVGFTGRFTGFTFVNVAHAQVSPEEEARLRAELAQVEQEQKETEVILQNAQNQSASLQRDILILDTKIKAAQLNIKAKNLLIQSLGKDITQKQEAIGSLEARIDRGKDSLSQIMRKTRELDQYTLPAILLSQKTLTGALSDVDNFESVQQSLKSTFEEIRSVKSQTETERDALDKRKNQEQDARFAIQQEQKNIEKAQDDKRVLLSESKSTEKTYAQILTEKKQKAAQIRAALFALRDAQAIPFADALQYATLASKATGIRPAFLLAILTQESSLGKNVGSCYLKDSSSGDGIGANTGTAMPRVMHPTRDIPIFMDIMKNLGGDPFKTRVSCWQPIYDSRGSPIGWGGAMGPAQFIPSTWVLFQDRIANAVGKSDVSPWNPLDAFMASAIYLTDLGAGSGTFTAEKNAACKYYSGSSCKSGSVNSTYGSQVLIKADTIQRTMIDALQGV